MKNLTVAMRLGIGFAAVISLLIVIAGLGLNRLSQLNDATKLIAQDRWVKAQLTNEISQHTSQIAIALRNMMLTDDRSDMAKQKDAILERRKAIADAIEVLQPRVKLPRGIELLSASVQLNQRYVAGQEKLISLIETGSGEAARQFLNHELRPILKDYQASLTAFAQFQAQLVSEASQSATHTYETARTVTFVAVLFAIAIAAGITAWIIRSVTGPLGGEPQTAKAVVERIAKGDLTETIRFRDGDNDSLVAATAQMQANLRRMIGQLKQNADSVAESAHQLAAGSNQVASASAEQSSAASAMASAVEEMTVSINHVSDSAQAAHQATSETGRLSQTSRQVISAMAAEMTSISQTVTDAATTIKAMGESSQKISSIVLVIKEVADQTNLLALNAAIEAARAGEQGRGFAVVADEVRKLAERTANATTEISSMIDGVQSNAQAAAGIMEQAVSRVESGVDKAHQANESVQGIADGAQHVVAAVNEISHALREQSAASNEIAANVEHIAQMSEQNSLATHSTAETAKRLESLADQTREAVRHFKV